MRRLAVIACLCALAGVAIMACVGAVSASAKVCSTEGTGPACAAGHGEIYVGRFVATISTPAFTRFTSGFIRVTCGEATMEGEITNGETGTGAVTKMTAGDCHSNLNTTSGSCSSATTASTANKYPMSVAATTAPNGTMTIQNLTTIFTCTVAGSNVTCRYKTEKAAVAVNGSDTAPTLVASEVPKVRDEISSPFCSDTGTWEALYNITIPRSLFIT